MNKKLLGAFYTTYADKVFGSYKDILSEQELIVDPFVGGHSLLDYAKSLGVNKTLGVDVNPDVKPCVLRDSLLNPQMLAGFVFTNPPYLYINKAEDKQVFIKWNTDDLYKASIKMLINYSDSGLIVVPQNIFLDEDWGFREYLFDNWLISGVVWHEGVCFDDTNVRVVSFLYEKGETTHLFGEPLINDKFHKLRPGYGWWEIQRTGSLSKVKVRRLIEGKETLMNPLPIVLNCTDTGSNGGEFAFHTGTPYYGKVSDRNIASFSINKNVDVDRLVDEANQLIADNRKKYGSKIFTNFLQSKGETRKRISFQQAGNLLKYIVQNNKEVRSNS